MSTENTCPTCHATITTDAPGGVCPACALRAGVLSEGDFTEAGRTADRPTMTAPSPAKDRPLPLEPEEMARRLPELEDFEFLGRGGMGAVYKARHRRLARPVAVKILDRELANDVGFADRFTREAQTLAKLDHPNIVRVYDFHQRDGLFVLIMELIDGVDLRQKIRSGGLAPEEALTLVPRLCDALQYAHDQGVVHRDIKPENILVDRDGAIKIADFGLAKLLGEEADDFLTRSRQVMGTPNYMAPEQVEHPGEVDHRADIFALGVVFYELLTGELPLGRFPLPSNKLEQKALRIDVRVDDVVLRTLEKEPELRYQQARELRSDVESLSRVGAASPVPPPAPRQAEPAPRSGFEYRSKATFLGFPLVHIAMDLGSGSESSSKTAMGWIAIGDVAFGGLAIGGLAIGGIAMGAASVGLLSLGVAAFGLFAALGLVSAGIVAFGGQSYSLIPVADSAHLLDLPNTGIGVPELLFMLTLFGLFAAGAGIALYFVMRWLKTREKAAKGPLV